MEEPKRTKKRKAEELSDKLIKTDASAVLKKIKKDAKKSQPVVVEDETPQLTTIKRGDVPEGFRIRPSAIKNKMKREEVYHRHKQVKKKLKTLQRRKRQKEREALGDQAPPKQEPRTIENTREFDETIVRPDDEEVMNDEQNDEFASHFAGVREPKVLITTSVGASKTAKEFCEELAGVFPNATFRERMHFPVPKIVEFAKNRDFTDVLVFNEDGPKINGALFIHLPDGPTAYFKVTSIIRRKEISFHATPTHHKPELILNNFNTRLGHSVGRMFASLFPQKPEFKGRRVVTFHNQRDFIFFRHHRYIFVGDKKARLQEIGPRFTLKLRTLQKGTFSAHHGEFIWVYKKEHETSRRRFFL